METSNDVAPGSMLLGKYRVDRVLGKGGMGVVLAATHVDLHEAVAIKLLLPELATKPDVVSRFMREARAAARLKSEHVARVIDVGRLPDGRPYLVMEQLHGSDLASLIEQGGPLAPSDAVDFLLQACEALAEAHALGIVHRDIKPANLFVTRRPGGAPLVKVLDFGISKVELAGDELTRTQTVMGTPSYMSPEQMRSARDVDARTDVWALGIVLYESLSGRLPFQADSYAGLVLEIVHRALPPLGVPVPAGLERVIGRCVAKDREARYATAAELAAALVPHAGDKLAAATSLARVRGVVGDKHGTTAGDSVRHMEPTTLGCGSGEIGSTAVRSRMRGLALAAAAAAVIGALIAVVRGGASTTDVRAAQPTYVRDGGVPDAIAPDATIAIAPVIRVDASAVGSADVAPVGTAPADAAERPVSAPLVAPSRKPRSPARVSPHKSDAASALPAATPSIPPVVDEPVAATPATQPPLPTPPPTTAFDPYQTPSRR